MLEKKKRAYLFRHVKKSQVVVEETPDSFLHTILKSIGCVPTGHVNEVDNGGGDSKPSSKKLRNPEKREESASLRSSAGTRTNRSDIVSSGQTGKSQVNVNQTTTASLKNPGNVSDLTTKPESCASIAKVETGLGDKARSIDLSFLEGREIEQPSTCKIDIERQRPPTAQSTIVSSSLNEVVESSHWSMEKGLSRKSWGGVISETVYDASKSVGDTLHWLSRFADDIPTTAQEKLMVLPSNITGMLPKKNFKEVKADQDPSPSTELVRNNSIVDSSSSLPVTRPMEPTQSPPEAVKGPDLLFNTRKKERTQNLPKTTGQPKLSSAPRKPEADVHSSHGERHPRFEGQTTKVGNPSVSSPVKAKIPITISRSSATTKQRIVPTAEEETRLMPPPHRVGGMSLQKNFKEAKADHDLSPLPELIRNNSIVDYSSSLPVTRPMEPTQNPPEAVEGHELLFTTRKKERTQNLPKTTGQPKLSSAPGKAEVNEHSFHGQSHPRLVGQTTKVGNPSVSSPVETRISKNVSRSRATTKQKHNTTINIMTTRPNSSGQGKFSLPPRTERMLPDSLAETVKVCNVHSMDDRDRLASSPQIQIHSTGNVEENKQDHVEEVDLVLGNPCPIRKELTPKFIGHDPEVHLQKTDRGTSLHSATAISRPTSPARKAKVARNECMELMLAPSLEGVVILKRRSSLKTLKKTRSLQRRSSGRRSPSRSAASRAKKIYL